ncbi:MAG: class I SAM-dependent methyltransferase, partial [Calditrichaeota bacterium]
MAANSMDTNERLNTPSSWLLKHENLLKSQPKNLALDIACGNGRNALYLASLGFIVDAVDYSEEKLATLAQQAKQLHLPICTLLINLEKEPLPDKQYQVVVNFNYLQRDLFPKIKRVLLRGGLLFFETFTRDHVTLLQNQMNPAYLLEPGELRQA